MLNYMYMHSLTSVNLSVDKLELLVIPYGAKFPRAVNFADFANSKSIVKIIFVKITIFDLLCPKLILTTNVGLCPRVFNSSICDQKVMSHYVTRNF